MAYTTVPTVVTGQTYTAADWNTYVKDNINAFWPYTALGDIAYASSTNTLTRLPIGSAGQYLGVSGGVPAWVSVKQVYQENIVAEATDVTTSSVGYFYVPTALNGTSLTRAIAFVATAGTTNATTVQIRNMTKYPSNDALSSAISIASGATTGTAGTVDTSYDDVVTNDQIKIYVTATSTTKPKGLWVVLEYQ